MTSPREVNGLAELQSRFAAALQPDVEAHGVAAARLADCVVDDGLAAARRVQVYRNNVAAVFAGALERTFPALRCHVGEQAFARLVVEYRCAHPSRSGDLHWAGERFAGWLESNGSTAVRPWLPDLARLEWACEEALLAGNRPALDADVLARVPADVVADARLALQPGLRLISSPFPTWSLWRAGRAGNPADNDGGQDAGPQHVAVVPAGDDLDLHSLPEERFRFADALASGLTLGGAVERSGLPLEDLPQALGWLFGSRLVTAVTPPVDSRGDGTPP
jgi:hypothetical protein